MFLELREKAESEKQSIINRFELRESGMRHLQDQQAAQIVDLERSLMEQQGRLKQLEQGLSRDEVVPCSQCGQERPVAQDEEHGVFLREKEDCALQLLMAQNRWVRLWNGGWVCCEAACPQCWQRLRGTQESVELRLVGQKIWKEGAQGVTQPDFTPKPQGHPSAPR